MSNLLDALKQSLGELKSIEEEIERIQEDPELDPDTKQGKMVELLKKIGWQHETAKK